MDKIFDALFSPRIFFKNSHASIGDSLKAILVLWITNVIVLYPSMKNFPFFKNYFFFALVLLAMFLLYFLWTLSIHFLITRITKEQTWKLPFVFLPHIVSGWIFTLSLRNAWISILFILPIGWSTIMEFYFVRAFAGKGMFYTVSLRIVRDLIFAIALTFLVRGWLS